LKSALLKLTVLACAMTSGYTAYAQSPAQANKVLHVAFEAPDDGFDMVKTYNYYSGNVGENIFEPLLTYDYMARPLKLVPRTALELPKIEQEGQVYTFKIRPGIFFTNDAAFKGKKRELVAQDYIYTIQRILDPANRSTTLSFIDGKIVGADAVVATAKKSGKFNYDAPIAGLKALDRYTLQITLTRPDYNFQYMLAYNAFGAVAREVIEHYGERTGQHPVGTGPYQLSKYVPRSKIELVANPDYRGFVWNYKSNGNAWDDDLVKQMQGKKMPQIGKIVISIIEEEQSRWLAFKSGQLDFDRLTSNAVEQALDTNNKLKPEMTKLGIQHYPQKDLEVTYTTINMRNPIVGGLSLDKIALRRAIALSYNNDEAIKLLHKGQAVKAQSFLPEGVGGHDPAYRNSIAYNPLLANKLLDRFGYKKGSDGYRSLPNGQPLTLKINTQSGSSSQMSAEFWKKSLDAVGLKVDFKVSNFADNLKEAVQCKHMVWGGAWIADYPEGENFAQLLYGPNAGQGNMACYESKAYDNLYEQAMKLKPEQRGSFYHQMHRQMEADTPWIMHNTRIRNWVIQKQVQGFKAHPILTNTWQFLDLQESKK
jgi:oligopeptide transport system substrate-binding protein